MTKRGSGPRGHYDPSGLLWIVFLIVAIVLMLKLLGVHW